MTYRGTYAKVEPVPEPMVDDFDPIYRLADLASDEGTSQTNEEMDDIIYGQ